MRMYFLPILLFSLTSTRALTLIFDIHVQHDGFSKMGTSCGQTVVMEVDDAVSTSTYQAEVIDPAQPPPSLPYIIPCTVVHYYALHCSTVTGVGRGLKWTVRDVTSGTVTTTDWVSLRMAKNNKHYRCRHPHGWQR